MLLSVLRRVGLFFILAAVALLQGCATVVIDNNASNKISVERDALKTAAADVAAVNWPKPQAISMSERLTGIVAGPKQERITKDEAIEVYVAALEKSPDPKAALIEDAETQLRAADVLTAAAVSAASAVRPVMADVAILEGAMGELRQAREIYLESLEEVTSDKIVIAELKRGLKSDFNRAIKEVGVAADLLADKVAADRTQTVATPNGHRSNFFGGSL